MIRAVIFSFALVLSISACGDDGGGDAVDCTMSTLTYDNFADGFFEDNCRTCHSMASTDRRGAPIAVNFDTLELVQNLSNNINIRAGEGTSMPPSFAPVFPTSAERDLLAEWIQCGARN
jgi:uncharacterized membrane protein